MLTVDDITGSTEFSGRQYIVTSGNDSDAPMGTVVTYLQGPNRNQWDIPNAKEDYIYSITEIKPLSNNW